MSRHVIHLYTIYAAFIYYYNEIGNIIVMCKNNDKRYFFTVKFPIRTLTGRMIMMTIIFDLF